MTSRWTLAAAALVLLAACDTAPGRPGESSEAVAPNDVVDFRALYGANCAGCHGEQGRGGAAIGLADPVYLAIADDASIRKVVANGVGGTSMPKSRAVCRLMANSNLVACTTGRSAGFSPLRIRPV